MSERKLGGGKWLSKEEARKREERVVERKLGGGKWLSKEEARKRRGERWLSK